MTRSLVARSAFRLLSIALACTAVVAGASRAQEPRRIAFGDSGKKVEFEPFFPDTTYAPDVPKPDTLLRPGELRYRADLGERGSSCDSKCYPTICSRS
jgi:hypothetical protein